MSDELTLEKQRVVERLSSVEVTLAAFTERIASLIHSKDTIHADLQSMLRKHNDTLYGNGQKGLTERVSIGEKTLGVLTKFMWAVGFTIFGIGAKVIIEYLFPGIHG